MNVLAAATSQLNDIVSSFRYRPYQGRWCETEHLGSTRGILIINTGGDANVGTFAQRYTPLPNGWFPYVGMSA